MICPGFPADCLETLEEIAIEGRDTFLRAGGREYRYIPCVNGAPSFIHALADLCVEHLRGWPVARGAEGRRTELEAARSSSADDGCCGLRRRRRRGADRSGCVPPQRQRVAVDLNHVADLEPGRELLHHAGRPVEHLDLDEIDR